MHKLIYLLDVIILRNSFYHLNLAYESRRSLKGLIPVGWTFVEHILEVANDSPLPTTSTHSMHPWGPVSSYGRCGMTKLWNHFSKQALHKNRGAWCAQSGRVNAMCWGALWDGYSMEGQWAAVAVHQNDHLRPTLLSWKQLQRRPNVPEKYYQVMKAIKPRVTSGSWCRKNWWWAKLVFTSFCCSERRQREYQSGNSFIIQQPDTVE